MKNLWILSIVLFSIQSHACIGGVFQAKAQGLAQELQINQQTSQQLMKLADENFKVVKDSRKELLKAWVNYTEKKNKSEREIANAPIKIRDAELNYQADLLKLKSECRDKANEHQSRVDREVTSNPVSNNPTRGRGAYRRQKNEWYRSLNLCMKDPIYMQSVQLAHKKMDNAILGISKEKEDSIAGIQVLHTTTVSIQQNALLTRKEALANLKYKEGVVRDMQAHAIAQTRQIASLNQTGAALQCFMQFAQSAGGGSSSGNSR